MSRASFDHRYRISINTEGDSRASRAIAYLQTQGLEVRKELRVKHYIVMINPNYPKTRLFIGRNGAVRRGESISKGTKSLTDWFERNVYGLEQG